MEAGDGATRQTRRAVSEARSRGKSTTFENPMTSNVQKVNNWLDNGRLLGGDGEAVEGELLGGAGAYSRSRFATNEFNILPKESLGFGPVVTYPALIKYSGQTLVKLNLEAGFLSSDILPKHTTN
jgi:hypothetical protein